MKRTALAVPKRNRLPLAWREAEYAALRADAADRHDDRVTENMFDAEGERAEVDNVVHGLIDGAH